MANGLEAFGAAAFAFGREPPVDALVSHPEFDFAPAPVPFDADFAGFFSTTGNSSALHSSSNQPFSSEFSILWILS